MYKRILLKLSGEALSSDGNIYSVEKLTALSKQIKKICDKGCSVGIVVGGGNMVRGKTFEKLGFDRVKADYMGMICTVVNAMCLESALKMVGQNAVTMSALDIEGAMPVDVEKAKEYLDNNTVVVFGGGIGNPFFSTDTACALRAIQIKADAIMMAKNGVDGVYDDDPDTNPNAKRFDKMFFDDILELNLKVMDMTAASLCRDNKVDAFVFDMNAKDNILKAVNKKATGTVITNK